MQPLQSSHLPSIVRDFRRPVSVVVGSDGAPIAVPGVKTEALLGLLPASYPEWLGARSFTATHGVRFPYIAGAMANGIASPALVIAMAEAHMLAFYGAGGLSYERVCRDVDHILATLGPDRSWGANLIHSPNEPALEAAVTRLYLERGVRRVSASAFMSLTPNVVLFACKGLHERDGAIARRNFLFAKISRPEVAARFMAPAPPAMVDDLVRRGLLTSEEAALARHISLAEDITVESDSGGHTDNRPLGSLFPAVVSVRDRIVWEHGWQGRALRVGAAGGLGTPGAVAAAFALGADYVLTGSVNQATREAGLSDRAKELLSQVDVADVTMAPSPDMFELGVKVQVVRRGTLFAQRAARLYDVYRAYDGIEAIPLAERAQLEREIFRAPLQDIWRETAAFFQQRNPAELERASADKKHQLALVCRWYVGKSSRWAIAGDAERALDYQIWCGPAMGAFNRWVAGTFLERWQERSVTQIALNLLEGACVVQRAQQLRLAGVAVPAAAFHFSPRPLQHMQTRETETAAASFHRGSAGELRAHDRTANA